MTKETFIDSVNELYAMRRIVAINAKCMIEEIIREKGEMSEEELYGAVDRDERDWVWLDKDSHLTGIQIKDGEPLIIVEDNEFSWRYGKRLDVLHQNDLIEIADYLCRM